MRTAITVLGFLLLIGGTKLAAQPDPTIIGAAGVVAVYFGGLFIGLAVPEQVRDGLGVSDP